MHDPLRTVYEALERADCEPRGPEHNFRSRCPVHQGDNAQSLTVREGADGRAVLFCHAHQCAVREITRALGLMMSELFPDHHRNAPKRRRPSRVRKLHPAVMVLSALYHANIDYRCTANLAFFVAERCPCCGFPDMWIMRDGEDVRLGCWSGCTPTEIMRTLTGNVWGERRGELGSLSVTNQSADAWAPLELAEIET